MSRTRAMPDTVLDESLRLGERFSATRRQKVVLRRRVLAWGQLLTLDTTSANTYRWVSCVKCQELTPIPAS